MKLGSLFDGIGGWPLAAVRFGIDPVWSSEIESFPQEVTQRHFPKMKHLGDITKINGAEIEPVDIITLGSPCQDLSVAGKRKGLDGERSGLFRTAINIVRRMRISTGGRQPRFIVWENVPGAFSSNKGHDFRAVLEEITETEIPIPKSGHYNKDKEWCIEWATAGMVRSNECEVAWRVMDAQYWGVPQRRKRIFLVADFRGQCAGEILFKPESVRGDFAESGSKGERTAGNIANCFRKSNQDLTMGFDSKDSIKNSMPVLDEKTPPIKTNNRIGVCLKSKIGGMTDVDEGMRPVKEHMGIVGTDLYNLATTGETACTLVCNMRSAGAGGPGVLQPKIWEHQISYRKDIDNIVAVDCRNLCENEVSTPLQSKNQGGYSLNYQNPVRVGYKVRRLTPMECERLQGLPDGYTLIDDKKCSDSARYKALGNGMAQPCPDFVIKGIIECFIGEA